ncbi:MAG: TlpA disulfide reductase family protein [Candidatus Omnitrophota bacterium]
MKIKKRFFILTLTLLLFITAGLLSCDQSSAVGGSSVAADFTLNDLDGKPFKMSDTKGSVVILDFWATWCPPCRMEIPHFEALYRQYKAKGIVIVGVALDRGGVGVVKPFIKEMGVTYPVVIGDQNVANVYGGIRGIPTTFIIDREGRIVEKAVGYRDKEFFESRIKELL